MKSEVTIYCPFDPDIALMSIASTDGWVMTKRPGNWTYEFIGPWVPSDDELKQLGISRRSVAIAKPAPGQEQHFRYHLRCPRATCSYHAEVGRLVTEQLHYFVHRMHKVGEERADIRDLDAWIRTMREINPDLSVLWTWMTHPITGGRQRVSSNPIAVAGQKALGWVVDDAP